MLRWSIEAGASGRFPLLRHDGKAFGPGDEVRAACAGEGLGCKLALAHLKGDWSEYCVTLGFPTWNSVSHPCIWCTSGSATLHNVAGLAPNVFPFSLKDMDTWEAACARCEIRVRFQTMEQLAAVRNALHYDKRSSGSKGRCLTANFPALGLKAGDRVEPTPELRDVADFDSLVAPCAVLFWRPANETHTRRRNPLFSVDMGVTLAALVVEMMHVMHLGVLQKFVSWSWWGLILGNVFGLTISNEEELIELSVHRLRAEYFAWVGPYRRAHPELERSFTQLPDLTPKTLGPKVAAFILKTKAAMTRPLVPFTLMLLQKYPDKFLGQAATAAAGGAMDRILTILREAGPVVPLPRLQEAEPGHTRTHNCVRACWPGQGLDSQVLRKRQK